MGEGRERGKERGKFTCVFVCVHVCISYCKPFLLHRGLKQLITPILAGLLETDASKVWDFDRFFREIMRVVDMKVL